jgi:hypothetical protein
LVEGKERKVGEEEGVAMALESVLYSRAAGRGAQEIALGRGGQQGWKGGMGFQFIGEREVGRGRDKYQWGFSSCLSGEGEFLYVKGGERA